MILPRLLAILTLCSACLAHAGDGIVVNAHDGKPVAGATVTSGNISVTTDLAGRFQLAFNSADVAARAPGFGRTHVALKDGPLKIVLTPFQAKAVYLSFYGIGSDTLRGAALDLIARTELNALVIDIKGDRGMLPYPSAVPLAKQIGAQKITTVHDMAAMVDMLHKKNVYLIARIVVFKDEPLATAHPEWAVKDGRGATWHDREDLAWTDPMRQDVWQYNLDIAEEAARLGFDEIQFDYVRFPDAGGLHFAQEATQTNRVEAITGFLAAARARLTPYNVFVAADIFGYVLWNLDDTAIGQQLERLDDVLDYICPMLYPSGFQAGIPGYRNPLDHPQEIVALSLQRGRQRTGLDGARFRPWLQAFPDYAFDRRAFGATQVAQQIDGANVAGASGYMLWNPHNRYGDAGLSCEAPCLP